MKYSCLNCKRLIKYFRLDESGVLMCERNHCSLGKEITNYDDAQTCYMYRPNDFPLDELEFINVANLILSLKHKLKEVRDVIDEIDELFEKK